jgi:uncharacterized protein with GYD domain
MTTYVMFANWTDQGIRNASDSTKRLDKAKSTLNAMGGKISFVFLTMGEFDLVIIFEAPDDAVAARFSIQLSMLGNVRTKTLKAFPEEAYRAIIASLA